MEIIDRIPENIRIYIQEIAERMIQGQVAVMVGSGFSKNAQPCCHTEKHFLNWNQLGDIFYKKLYGKFPGEEDIPCYYQDILKLASKVQQTFGRTILDKLLLDNLPDEEYEPSKLHESLLKLNWADIFTTNYDTLLERTRAKVFTKRYQVVLNKDDLVYSKCPRIIKLHGSFPSTRPFVITEEDYRKYPQENAVFVNTVRQSLIENIMCMIGFSGDDPNFLNWIGWIHDHLGNESSSKIYLIGVFDIKETALKLYSSRNIVLLNMKECNGIEGGMYEEGLDLFFKGIEYYQNMEGNEDFISDNQDRVCQLITVLRNQTMHSALINNNECIDSSLKEIADEWEKERNSYKGWIIMPHQKREKMEKSIGFGGVVIRGLKNCGYKTIGDNVGKFLYELNWRREQCLLPMGCDMAEICYKYLDQQTNDWCNEDRNICLSLLQYWREHGDFDKWEVMKNRLEEKMDEVVQVRLYWENATKMLYNFEYANLSNLLNDRSDLKNEIGMEFKISSLLAELGYYERAILFLKKSLDDIRKQMGNKINYQYYSKEAYLIDLLENMERYYEHLMLLNNTNDTDNHSHLNKLKGYDCNPEYERDYLIRQSISSTYSEYGTIKHQLIESAIPEQYIKFMEKTGMIFRASYLFKHAEQFPALLVGLIHNNPYLALICSFRFGDPAICKQVWGKVALTNMHTDVADMLIVKCIEACKKNKEYMLFHQQKDNLACVLPELVPIIITGLLERASREGISNVVDFIIYIYENPQQKFSEVEDMIKGTISFFPEQHLDMLVSKLIDLPFGYNEGEETEELREPFLFFNLAKTCNYIPSDEQLNRIYYDAQTNNKCIRQAAYIRLLVIDIICNLKRLSEETLKSMRDYAGNSTELLEIIEYYDLKNSGSEQQDQIRAKWVQQLEYQIECFANAGPAHCSTFRQEIGRLLKRERYYRTLFADFIWNTDEIENIICYMEKWVDLIGIFRQHACIEISYYEGWCILEELLLEVFLPTPMALGVTCKENLSKLEQKLKELEIPFLLQQILVCNSDFTSEEIYDLFLANVLKGVRERAEAEKILCFCRNNGIEIGNKLSKLYEMIGRYKIS